jgi:CubicO group peptidase (beta-lactamase class C family)
MVKGGSILLAFGAAAASEPIPGLTAVLQDVARNVSEIYNCSISIAFRNADGKAAAAYGTTNYGTGRQAEVSDKYAWGSCTKMLTGASILKLVSDGKFGLDDPVAPLIDPFLKKMASKDTSMDFTSMADLWGAENITNATVRSFLGMTQGAPDFDTANPCRPQPCEAHDPLRKALYDEPSHSFSPAEVLKLDWVRGAWRQCKPRHSGSHPFCYSSTNYMLLGMILANQAGVSSWQEFDQAAFLPKSVRDELEFAKIGVPRDYEIVDGYDRTSYNAPAGEYADHDNIDVAGVFSGWTASDILGSASAIADLTWLIHAEHAIAPKKYTDMMKPEGSNIYGLAAHNGQYFAGVSKDGKYKVAYGHLGATYGYQSVTMYFPALNVVVAAASNIELDSQPQANMAMCFAYHKAAGLMLGKEIHCEAKKSHWGTSCVCDSLASDETVVA